MTPLKFTLSDVVLIDAARIHNACKWPRFAAIYATAIAAASFGFSYLYGHYDLSDTTIFMLLISSAGLLFCALLFLVTRYWTIPHRVRKALTNFASVEQEAEWNDTHFQLRSSDGHSSLKFGRFAGWRRTSNLLMLYRTDELYYVLPSTFPVTSGHLDDLVNRIRSEGVREK